jgi:hypothetical protein
MNKATHSTAKYTVVDLLGRGSSLLDEILLEHAHELGLLVGSLEAAVTKLGRGVDELEVDLLLCKRRDEIESEMRTECDNQEEILRIEPGRCARSG